MQTVDLRAPRRPSRRGFLRMAALAGGAVTAATMLACGSKKPAASQSGAQSSAEAPKPGGTLNVALASNTLLDPHLLSAGVSVMSAALSRPFRFKSGIDPQVTLSGEIESDLALSAESPDGVTWTLKLRPNAVFHDIPPVSGRTARPRTSRQPSCVPPPTQKAPTAARWA